VAARGEARDMKSALFDRGYALVTGGDHSRRACNCGHRWVERCACERTDPGQDSVRRADARCWGPAVTQPMDSMIFRYWPSSNALRVADRMLPPLAIEMA